MARAELHDEKTRHSNALADVERREAELKQQVETSQREAQAATARCVELERQLSEHVETGRVLNVRFHDTEKPPWKKSGPDMRRTWRLRAGRKTSSMGGLRN